MGESKKSWLEKVIGKTQGARGDCTLYTLLLAHSKHDTAESQVLPGLGEWLGSNTEQPP